MNTHFADRLLAAIERCGAAACVGLDPVLDQLPAALLRVHGIRAELVHERAELDGPSLGRICGALEDFGCGVIEAVAGQVPAIKINIAFFERYFHEGVAVYYRLVDRARRAGLVVIGDVKRGDIGHTSGQYALAHLSAAPLPGGRGATSVDAVTVNPYFGIDGVQPFLDAAHAAGAGLFVLVQTSNESAAEVQGLVLPDGATVCQHVARLVQRWACAPGAIGTRGYSLVGAVVSPRDLPSTRVIRALMPDCLFLVPGFGAQGRNVDEVRTCFKPDGTGAIVTASRSVIYAYREAEKAGHDANDWQGWVRRGCNDFVGQIRGLFVR